MIDNKLKYYFEYPNLLFILANMIDNKLKYYFEYPNLLFILARLE